MEAQIREVLTEHGKLVIDPVSLDVGADLYEAGLTSHANVAVMLALEDAFSVEFPDALLRRSTFASISAIQGVLAELVGVQSPSPVASA